MNKHLVTMGRKNSLITRRDQTIDQTARGSCLLSMIEGVKEREEEKSRIEKRTLCERAQKVYSNRVT